MLSSRYLVLPCFVFLAGCSSGKDNLDPAVVDVLNGAARVEVFRVKLDFDKSGEEARERMGPCVITARGNDQGKEFAARLRAILYDRSTYSNSEAKCFTPGVAFRIWKDKKSVDVYICFHCDNFLIKTAEHESGKHSFLDTAARGKLVQLAKDAFPDDPEIQSLTMER